MRIITLSLLLASLPALAEHLPGGSITTRCISGNQHQITLKLWRECTGAPMIAQSLAFSNSCGVQFSVNVPLISVENVSPVCPDQIDQTTCNGGPFIGIEMYTYQLTTNLSACNFWTVAWNTCCRYPSANLNGAPGIYIEAELNNAGNFCTEGISFADPVPPFVCVGQPVSYDPGVIAPANLDLRYSLIDARRQVGVNPVIVEAVTYQSGYSGEEPFTGMAIDSLTGNITFTPTLQGYVITVVRVDFYDANGIWRGSVMRDFPFVAQACDNVVPDAASGVLENLNGSGTITGNYSANTCSGSLCLDAVITDADAIQALTLTSNIGQVIPGATFNATGSNPATATLCIDASSIASGTYTFSIIATDNACPVVGSQTFTYTLTVQSATASAGADASATICPGESIDLETLLTGDPGGIWSDGPIVSAAGTYTYSLNTNCGADEAIFTITEAEAPNAGEDAVASVCEGSEIDLMNLINGSAGGEWPDGGPLVSTAGTYTYLVTTSCGTDEASFEVTLIDAPDAGSDNTIFVCPQATAFSMIDSLLGTPQPGGIWLLESDEVGSVFDPSLDTEGNYCYVITSADCGEVSACLRIIFQDPAEPECISLGVVQRQQTAWIGPNPSNGQLLLTIMGPSAIDLHDASGRLAWSARIPSAGQYTLQLPGSFTDGSYLLRITEQGSMPRMHRFELIR